MSYGWFPKLNSLGHVVSSGKRAEDPVGRIAFNDQVIGDGFGQQWYDDALILVGQELVPHGRTSFMTVDGSVLPITDISFNKYTTDGDRWAGERPGIIYVYQGPTFIYTMNGGSPLLREGRFGYLLDDNHRLIVDDVTIVQAPIMDWAMDGGRIGWVEATGMYMREVFVDHQRVSYDEWEGSIQLFGHGWLMTYHNPPAPEVGSYKIRPIGSNYGYRIWGDAFNPDVRLIGDVIVFVASDAQGNSLRYEIPVTQAREDLTGYAPPIPPIPPNPEDNMKPPIVTVDNWTLDDVLEGREFRFHDDGNPELGISARVWVQGGVMYASFSNKAGTHQTGARRVVKPCSQDPTPGPDPEPEPEPPVPEPSNTFTLRRHDGAYICVGQDDFLTTIGQPAAFEVVPQPNGKIGLKADGYYVAAEGDNRLKADREAVGDWEYFIEHPLAGGTFAYQSWKGFYISVHDDGTVAADQPAIGGWETLEKGEVQEGTPILGPLRANGRVFRDVNNAAWRWRGVSAFPLHRRFADGVDIQPFLDTFKGYNVLRLFAYVTWPGTGWEMPEVPQFLDFLAYVRARGWYVELCLLTDDDPGRIQPAKDLVTALAQSQPDNLLLEIGNEPTTHKNIDTAALRSVCEASGFLFSSGDYEDSHRFFGTFLTAHTPRDAEWPRKGHDLMEYYNGGGPSAPTDPAHPVPCIGDEPIRPDQCNPAWWPTERDYQAYGAVCALLGGGATFHFEGGKFGNLPNNLELNCAAAMLHGLTAFPDDAPNWGYRRIDEQGQSLRTYVLGDRCMVRVRPTTQQPPEAGWTPLDGWAQLFTR